MSELVVPRITTERLLLREHRRDDFPALAAHMSDADACKYTGGPSDRRNAWRFLLAGVGGWHTIGSGWWSVEERASGALLGSVGAFVRETQLERGADADLELGWSLFRAHWRRGFAREAALAALTWAIGTHDPRRIVAHIAKENTASIVVARAIGLHYAGDTDFYGEPTQLYVFDRRAGGLDGAPSAG